jgi:hypothetical protein
MAATEHPQPTVRKRRQGAIAWVALVALIAAVSLTAWVGRPGGSLDQGRAEHELAWIERTRPTPAQVVERLGKPQISVHPNAWGDKEWFYFNRALFVKFDARGKLMKAHAFPGRNVVFSATRSQGIRLRMPPHAHGHS